MMTYTTAFAAVIHKEVLAALRAGTPIESIMAALGSQIKRLQAAQPIVTAIKESEMAP